MRAALTTAAAVAALTACLPPEAPSSPGWARTFPAARYVTAPAAWHDDVAVAVTAVDSGAVLDERGVAVDFLAGNARRATCSVMRIGTDGAVRWSLPVIVRGGQSLCTSVVVARDDVLLVRGEAFDIDDGAFLAAGGLVAVVDEGFALTLAEDGVARSLEATPPPVSAFPEGGADIDVLGRTLTAPSRAGYLSQSGAVVVDDVNLVSLLVPQGTDLAPLVDGARSAPQHLGADDESVVVLARIVD